MRKVRVLNTDAFFRSQRDINRHHCWLHFWKIQINSENFIFLHFWGRLGEIFQKWPYFWVFGFFYVWDFFLKNFFFPCRNQILKMLFKYMCKFRTSSEKFEIRTIQISWKIYKILKTVEFFNMWLFISKIKNLNFCICQNTHFCCSGLGQVSSWWINSIFCVGKVSIWRCP